MAQFDRSYTTFYWWAIVWLYVVPLSSYLTLNNCNLEIWIRGHWRPFQLVPFKSLGAVFYSPSIVTMALHCIIFEIKRDIGRKPWFFYTPLHSTSPLRGPRRNIAIPFGVEKLQGVSEKSSPPPKTFWNIFTSVKSFCVKICKFVGSSYPDILTSFCRFILIFHQMALIFPRVPFAFTLSSFE